MPGTPGGLTPEQIEQLQSIGAITPDLAQSLVGTATAASTPAQPPLDPLGYSQMDQELAAEQAAAIPQVGTATTALPVPGAPPELMGPPAPAPVEMPPSDPLGLQPMGLTRTGGVITPSLTQAQAAQDVAPEKRFTPAGLPPGQESPVPPLPPKQTNVIPFGSTQATAAPTPNGIPGLGGRAELYDQGVELQQRATRASADITADLALKEQGILDELVARSRADANFRQHEQDYRDWMMTKTINETQRLSDEIKNSQIVSQKPGTQDILAAIIGGIGSALTGGPNVAVDIINRRIDRDIALQREALGRKKDALDMQNNIYGMYLKKFGQEDQAMDAARVAYLDTVNQQIRAAAAGFKAPQVVAAAEAAVGALEAEKQKTMIELGLKAAKGAKPPPIPSNTGDWRADIILDKVPKHLQKEAFDQLGTYKQNLDVIASTEQAFDKLRDIAAIDQMMPWSPDRARAQSERNGILIGLQAIWKGPLSDQDTKTAMSMIPGTTATREQVEEQRQVMLRHIRENLKPTPLVEVYGLSGKQFELRGATPTAPAGGQTPIIKRQESQVGPTDVTQNEKLFKAIVGNESGGREDVSDSPTGAVGIGQVLKSNIPDWTEEATGKRMTPEEYSKDIDAQKKTIRFKLNQYYQEGLKKMEGVPEPLRDQEAARYVAAKWYTGDGDNMNDKRAWNVKKLGNGRFKVVPGDDDAEIKQPSPYEYSHKALKTYMR